MKPCEEVSGGLLIARSNGPKMLDRIEEAFDEVAFTVEREVTVAFGHSVRFGRDDRFDGAYRQALDEVIGVISLVGEKGLGFDACQECGGLCDVVGLPTGKAERERIAQGVDDHVDFGREPAARATDGLVEPGFFLAPALC